MWQAAEILPPLNDASMSAPLFIEDARGVFCSGRYGDFSSSERGAAFCWYADDGTQILRPRRWCRLYDLLDTIEAAPLQAELLAQALAHNAQLQTALQAATVLLASKLQQVASVDASAAPCD